MAKKSSVARNLKRKHLSEKYLARRREIKEKLRTAVGQEQMELQQALARLPRNSSPCRVRNRCELTGRPRGYYRKFGLARNELRRLAMLGMIPGVTKASW